MNINLDIKTTISILAVAAILGGFYYTTQHRLDDLEAKIKELEVEVEVAKKLPRTPKNKR
jgi:hypothetical protein